MNQVPDTILERLSTIRDLLWKHDFPGQARVVEGLISLAQTDVERFANEVTGGAMWGGSGAVWEVGSFKGHKIADAEAACDEIRFRRAIIDLTDALAVAGIGTERIAWLGSVLRKWDAKCL